MILPPIASGQPLPQSVFGKIAEFSTQDPLEFANIVLSQLPDSITIQRVASDITGNFNFTDVPAGHYFLEITLLGFEIIKTAVFEINTDHGYDAGTISLQASSISLNEIEIAAKNPAFVNGIDRKTYYPENDIMAQSGTVSDVLQNIPSITIDAEGEINLRGSENIHFLLNGKPSGLLKNNPAIMLEQLPANTIERIEIITNPSAKYKPDGVAGIINIITKKNTLTGFHGNVMANASTQRRYNGNISLNYNPGKFNISALYGYMQNYFPRTGSDFRIVRDSFSEAETMFDLKSNGLGKPKSHTTNLSIDYQPDTNNSLGVSGTYFNQNARRMRETITQETNSAGIINDFNTFRNDVDKESELELSAYAEHAFKKEDHTISFEAQYGKSDELEESQFCDVFRLPAYPTYQGHNRLDKKGHATTLTTDYTNPFDKDTELETGYEGEYSSGDLDYYS
ncbi:MAG: outer membrane beta-barrel protein, partial [Saprospiraceae bacterium]